MNLNQITLPVDDMQNNCDFYRLLGFNQIVDTPHYARFECPEGDATFSLSLVDLNNRSDGSDVAIYFEHESLDQYVESLVDKGVVFEEMPTDKRYLWREATLFDPAGNKLKLYWAGSHRKYPPWRVSK